MKKIIIIEFVHYQYALTLTEFFKNDEIIYIFSSSINESIRKFNPIFNSKNIWIYEPNRIKTELNNLINKINKENPDLLCIDPIFDNFKEFAQISKKINSKILFTTHNINTWFKPSLRSINNLKEKIYKSQILKNVDYIAVEDFIYNHLKNNEKNLFNKYNFVYIPYTIYYGNVNKIKRNDDKIKIVLPGSIDKERRTYEDTVLVIRKLVNEGNNKFIFSFAGPAYGEYGNNIIKELEEIKELDNNIVIFYKDKPSPEEFRYEMESADIVLSTSTKYFYTLGTKEEIGKTKPTAAIHDMVSFVLPGILPKHLNIPKELISSSLQYETANDLYNAIISLLTNNKLEILKNEAKNNSLKYTPEEILKRNIITFL